MNNKINGIIDLKINSDRWLQHDHNLFEKFTGKQSKVGHFKTDKTKNTQKA